MSEENLVADVVVVGAGVIGLAIALELQERGARVVVVERGKAMRQASIAAAGMLAVDDPANPAELLPLARLSAALYPPFLRRIEALSGTPVPFQTESTFQYGRHGNATRLSERSIDPRQLAQALLAAALSLPIRLLEETALERIDEDGDALKLRTSSGVAIFANAVVYATGAWAAGTTLAPVSPRKGQMMRVRTPDTLALREVHRSELIYIVPRTFGPQAGTALIGATVEDVGFDVAVHAEDLARLRSLAAGLVPQLAAAPMIEAWAGLRPATPDDLPLLGTTLGQGRFIAGGHYRNGVLLAPATAAVMADLLTGGTPAIDLTPFSPQRFSR
jgi:glycine oxidase